ncbi:MarR family winged helix-turn-helix transcriptional regulator [Streptosporangium subroseum]|uniref:MarR family winged helix-turn-helix transcriptional regulator n=1 Tax=Streptosporangium subroseum TaxID=106412 RepID=UPI003423F5C9
MAGSAETSEDRFFHQLTGAYAEVRQAFARHVGMSRPRLQVLMRLWRDGETSHSDLRRILSLDGASVTRLIKEFEGEGMINRRIDPEDNRYTLARLTPEGERVAAELAHAHQAYQVRLLDGVTGEEQEIVLRALDRLRVNVERIERDHADR